VLRLVTSAVDIELACEKQDSLLLLNARQLVKCQDSLKHVFVDSFIL